MSRKRTYAELRALHAKVNQEQAEAEAVAKAQSGNGGKTTTLTQNVQRESRQRKHRKGKRKFNKNSGLLWGGNFTAFESTNNKKDKDSLAPEF